MQFKKGMVVRSMAGHDKNRFYILMDIKDDRGFIADGKRRRLEKLKSKNLIHLSATKTVFDVSVLDTNLKIRRILFPFNDEQSTAIAK